jgi:hypothetical protein
MGAELVSNGDTFEANTEPDIYADNGASMQCYQATGYPMSSGTAKCTVSPPL